MNYFSSTHERSHIFCSYGMSPYKQGQPVYFLLWEGSIGSFYEINEKVQITKLGEVMPEPGNKYAFLFSLADPSYKDIFRFESAGKLMALAAYSDRSGPDLDEKKIIDYILNESILLKTKKSDLKWSKYYNIGIDSQAFRNLAGKLSDAIFNKFYEFASNNCTKGYPLLIAGGCGLNCEWNTKWKNCGLFPDVFVPPIANDTGSALGTAIEAQYYYYNDAKINWDVYSGASFIIDQTPGISDWKCEHLDYSSVSSFLKQNNVIAWVQDRCEIGPRALGNRSLLASPLEIETRDLLNHIKGREDYRPIAPLCIEEDVSAYFEWTDPSPHMLFFQKVKSKELAAITHVDKTARVQTVNRQSNSRIYDLLQHFKKATGFGVLCNTSLNYNGRGFINCLSDLVSYCLDKGIKGFVVNDNFYSLKK